MELFKTARVVRLRSHHDKYLLADEDHESVCQDRDGTVRNARWTVEFVKNSNTLRFKSCYGKYLTASNMPFRLGLRGKKVQQTLPKRLDSSLEWEPIREGCQVRLKTPYGQFLRANGGVPPWRNSITHDVPHRTATQDWVLWDIDVIEFRPESPEHRPESPERRPVALPPPPPPPESPERRPESPERQPESPESRPVALPPPPPPPELLAEPTEPTSPSKIELRSPRTSKEKSSESLNHGSPMKGVGRMIHYHVANDKGDVEDSAEEFSFSFKGSEVEGLKKKLKEEIGLEEIVVCSRNPLNGKLYPIRLHLPPNNHDMHVVVVPSSSEGSDL
ncbi:uncharacterized protein LOC110752475 isoform X2 [Prunus avium]|uniref:Uncharacterized protein LOC110752475 isoform X2 n=1 Tax=Prunus avium TaxID=42229 RepID=A0A6P5S2D4_PRUAV|nr:uncharacterized protein LOC110752475 isoform X2 [Prunus avium]